MASGTGCEGPEGLDQEIEQSTAALVGGGEISAENGIHVRLTSPNLNCSGTLLNDTWLVTFQHCASIGTVVTRGSEQRTVAEISIHPQLPINLARLNQPFAGVGRTSIFPLGGLNDSRLQDQTVRCYGYTSGSKLTTALMRVTETGWQMYDSISKKWSMVIEVKSDTGNIYSDWFDAGGGCFLDNPANPALVGVAHWGTFGDHGTYVSTSQFSQWAIRTIGAAAGYSNAPYSQYPSFHLICHGQECVTRPVPPALLPNDVYEEAAWRPCPNVLSGPGSYEFDFEASYDLEQGYDSLLLDGEYRTGQGVITGRTAASHLGNALSLYTDFSVNSVGLNYLRGRCPGDP